MRTRVTSFFVKIIVIALIGVAAFYFLAAYIYRSGFSYGTKINGIYCAGLSVSEVSERLGSERVIAAVKVTFPGGESVSIPASDIKLSVNYESELTQLRYSQNPMLWGLNLFESTSDRTVDPVISFDRDKLSETIANLDFIKEHDPSRIMLFEILPVDGVYSLLDTTGPSIDPAAVEEYVYSELCRGNTDIVLQDSLLKPYVMSDKDKAVLRLWDEISAFIAPGLNYDMGDEIIELDAKFLSSLLEFNNGEFVRNEDGKLKFDSDKLTVFIDALCDRYDTLDKPRTFIDYNGETKTLERNLYGTLLDRTAEEQYIVEAIKTGVKETHVPKYLTEPYHRGLDDIGPDHIEIDITRQKLYFIKDGKLDVETDVVTGNPRTLHATNEMVTSVQKLSTNTYLRGEGYRSFVKYWIAVYKNTIGIHDA